MSRHANTMEQEPPGARPSQPAKVSALPSMPIECRSWRCHGHLRERQPDAVKGSESAISDSGFALAAGVAPNMSGRTDARRQALRRELSAMPHGPGRPDPPPQIVRTGG
jgi:hypothetical protein